MSDDREKREEVEETTTIYLLTDKKGHTLATKRNTQKLWFWMLKWLELTACLFSCRRFVSLKTLQPASKTRSNRDEN